MISAGFHIFDRAIATQHTPSCALCSNAFSRLSFEVLEPSLASTSPAEGHGQASTGSPAAPLIRLPIPPHGKRSRATIAKCTSSRWTPEVANAGPSLQSPRIPAAPPSDFWPHTLTLQWGCNLPASNATAVRLAIIAVAATAMMPTLSLQRNSAPLCFFLDPVHSSSSLFVPRTRYHASLDCSR